jgi:hypothetical protein
VPDSEVILAAFLEMHYSAPQLVLALLPVLMLFIVATEMLIKKLYFEFPLFFAYSIFHIVSISATLIASGSNPWSYFYTYWGFQVADMFLSIAVVQEIYSQTLEPYDAIRNLGGALFRWATMMLLILALISASVAPGSDSERIMAGLLVLSRSANFLIGGLLLLLFMICSIFAVAWKRYAFGIALGFALLSSISLSVFAFRAHVGETFHHYLQVVSQLSYNIAAAIWVIAVVARQSSTIQLSGADRRQLREWNRILEGLLRK